MLEVVPKELIFSKPADTQAVVTLTLKNTAKKWLVFRVMTSAPDRFSVRPVTGTIKGHGTVSILIQYRPPEPPPSVYPDFKFRIKAVPVDNEHYGGNDLQLNSLWNGAPSNNVLTTTITCNFPKQYSLVHSTSRTAASAEVTIVPVPSDGNGPIIPSSSRTEALETSHDLHQNYRRALEDVVLLRDENIRLREDLHRVRRSLARVHAGSGDPIFSALRSRLPAAATALLTAPVTFSQRLLSFIAAIRLGALTVLMIFFCAGIFAGKILYS